MSQRPPTIEPLESLPQQFCRGHKVQIHDAIAIAWKIGRQLAELHAAGSLLRDFDHGIQVDESCHIELVVPTDAVTFGGADADLECCPPELQSDSPVNLPASMSAAISVLSSRSVACSPARVDVYLLGALLCRAVTGDTVRAYLQSLKTRRAVPNDLQTVIDAALGYDPHSTYQTMDELVAALEGLLSDEPRERDTDGPKSMVHDTDAFPVSAPSSVETGDLSRQELPVQPPPKRLRDYDILEPIGQGGMGDVYRAFEGALNRVVAIKVLPAELARQPEFVNRFRAEATAVAGITHPNVIQIYSIGEDAGQHFFAMQYIEGESLAHLLRRHGKLSIDQTVEILVQVLAGLSAAHRRGIVHRDIKPGNILLDSVHHRAIVADFGLVKCIDTSGKLTATGIVMGTVDYLSPEQGRGHPVDQRSDLYSVGVLAYHMLSGRLPFRADSATAMVFQHVYEEPPALHDLCPGLSVAVCAVVHRLLAKSVAERYESADETIAAFRKALNHSAAAPDVARPIARDRTDSSAAVDSDIALPSALDQATGWWQRLRLRALVLLQRRAPQIVEQLQNTQQQVDGAVVEYEARRNQLQAVVSEAEESLDALRQQAESHRAAANDLQQQVHESTDDTEVRHVREDAKANEAAAASLEQQAQAQSQELDTMRLRLAQINLTLGKLRGQRDVLNARLKMAQARGRLEASPKPRSWRRKIIQTSALVAGGTFLCFAVYWNWPTTRRAASPPQSEKERFTVANSAPGALGQQIFASEKDISSVALGRQRLVLGHTDGTVDVLLIREDGTAQRLSQLSASLSPVTAVALSPDEELFAMSGQKNSILIWAMSGGNNRRELKQLTGHEATVTDLAFSPDGLRLLSSDQSGALFVWDVVRGEVISHSDSASWIQSITWSRDGSTVLIGNRISGANSLSLWNLPDNREVRTLYTDNARTEEVAFSLSEGEVYSHAGGAILIQDRDKNNVTQTFGESIVSAAFSPITRRVWTADLKGALNLWDARDGSVLQSFTPQQNHIQTVALSADGRIGVSASVDGEVHIWRLPAVPAPPYQLHSVGVVSPVAFLSVSPLAAGVLTNAAKDIEFWDMEKGQKRYRYEVKTRVTTADFSRDGRLFVYGTDNQYGKPLVGLREVSNRLLRDTQQFVGHEGIVTSVAILSSNKQVVSGSLDGTVRVWDAATGESVKQLKLLTAVTSIALSPDNEFVLIGGQDGLIRHWKWQATDSADEWKGHNLAVSQVRFAAGGQRAISGSADQKVIVWNTQTGAPVQTLSGHTGKVNAVALSRNGLTALSGGDDGLVRVWDVSGGKVSRQFEGHLGAVLAVSFSTDGMQAISGGEDQTLRTWDLPLLLE